MKQIKLDYVTNEKFNKEITISGNFITRAYQIFNGKTLENGEKIEDIIKLCNNNIGNKFLMPNKNLKVLIQNKKINFIKIALHY